MAGNGFGASLKDIKTIIFDLDGTLYDSTGLPLKLVRREFARCAFVRIGAERLARKRLAGRAFASESECYGEFFSLISYYSGCSVDSVSEWYNEQYTPDFINILKKNFVPRAGLDGFLESLCSRGYRLAVFSDYGSVPEKIDALGIDRKYFAGLYDAPELGGLKPCPASFRHILSKLGAEPSETLMVGDRDDTDGAGAHSVGMQYVRVFKSEKKAAEYRAEHPFDGSIPPLTADIPPLRWEEFTGLFRGL